MKVKEESKKVGSKLNIQKIKIMASSLITSWQTDGETVETVADFIFWGSKITADGDCNHGIKRCSLLGRKVMTNLDSILQSWDITLPTKVHLVKAMVFPVVMYGCESWTIKKAENRRIDAFELRWWRRCLRVLWTARRSNQSILKEIRPGYSLEGLMLKLKLQYFGHLMWRADSFEKTLMLGKIEGRRRRGRHRMRWLDGITDLMDMGLADSGSWWWTGRPGVLQFMGQQRVGHDWVAELTEWQQELRQRGHTRGHTQKKEVNGRCNSVDADTSTSSTSVKMPMGLQEARRPPPLGSQRTWPAWPLCPPWALPAHGLSSTSRPTHQPIQL